MGDGGDWILFKPAGMDRSQGCTVHAPCAYLSWMKVDPNTGEQKWKFEMTDVTDSGVLSTAGGLVFQGNPVVDDAANRCSMTIPGDSEIVQMPTGVARMRSTPHQRPEVTQPRLGAVGWLRWTWRQLTSMRTALFLLLLRHANTDLRRPAGPLFDATLSAAVFCALAGIAIAYRSYGSWYQYYICGADVKITLPVVLAFRRERGTFLRAAEMFAGACGRIGSEQWARPGLGEWDVFIDIGSVHVGGRVVGVKLMKG